jgi:hypothetical protein
VESHSFKIGEVAVSGNKQIDSTMGPSRGRSQILFDNEVHPHPSMEFGPARPAVLNLTRRRNLRIVPKSESAFSAPKEIRP